MEIASVAFLEESSGDREFGGYGDHTRIDLTNRWIERNVNAGPPPSEASFPLPYAFSALGISTAAMVDIEIALGTENNLFYKAIMTFACIHYSKGHSKPALQWIMKLPNEWLQNCVQSFLHHHGADKSKRDLLLLAIRTERFDVAFWILQSTPLIGTRTNGPNFLYEAAARGSLPIITLLHTTGSSIIARGRSDAQVLSNDQLLALSNSLSKSSAHRSSYTDQSQNDTALFAAIRNGRLSAVRLLLDLGADIETLNVYDTNDTGSSFPLWKYFTSLGFAVSLGQKEIVELLIDRGAESNPKLPQNTDGSLISLERIKLSMQLRKVEQPLLFAMERQNTWNDSLIALLIKRGADQNADPYFMRPLTQAIQKGNTQAVIQLLAAGANVNAHLFDNEPDLGYEFPFHVAIGGYPQTSQIILELLRKGVDMKYSNKGWPPLIIAIQHRNPGLVGLLLREGANPEPQGKRRISPLIERICLNELDLTQLPRASGASKRRPGYTSAPGYDERRFTPIEFAQVLERRRIQKILAVHYP